MDPVHTTAVAAPVEDGLAVPQSEAAPVSLVATEPAAGGAGFAGAFKRRGLIALAGALATAALAKVTAAPAHAADGGPLVLGQANSASSPTSVAANVGGGGATLSATNTGGSGFGLTGTGQSGAQGGVLGNGLAAVNGVVGQSASGIGVLGTTSGAGPGTQGVSGSGPGVYGTSTSGQGVYGVASSQAGVAGLSSANHGLVGRTDASAAGFAGLSGFTNKDGCFGVSGGTGGNPNSYAAVFYGRVTITGDLNVGGIKSAVVPHPDGTLRRVYSVESPQSYLEDFGRAQLVDGQALVELDPDFRVLVDSSDYDVFLTPRGDCSGLFVKDQTSSSFSVGELQDGTSGTSFSYRIIAKRNDIIGPRLQVVPPVPPPRPAPPEPQFKPS